MDLPSRSRWYDYSLARDKMLEATDTETVPWFILRSDDKKRARLNCISHLLSMISYKSVPRAEGGHAEAIKQGGLQRSSDHPGSTLRARDVLKFIEARKGVYEESK